MRKVLKNKNLIILIAVLFVFLGITLSSINSNSPGKESRKKVSFIVYGDDSSDEKGYSSRIGQRK